MLMNIRMWELWTEDGDWDEGLGWEYELYDALVFDKSTPIIYG